MSARGIGRPNSQAVRGVAYTRAYTPLSALSGAQQRIYLRVLAEKRAKWPTLYNTNAAREGLKRRVLAGEES